MDFANLLQEQYVISFFLLFVRFSAIFTFMPFYSDMTIPVKYRAALAFFLTVMFYSQMPPTQVPLTNIHIIGAILSEMILGFFSGLFLQIVMFAILFAGEKVAFMMGFSMATVVDPQANMQIPVISKLLSILSVAVLLAIDAHHSMLVFMSQTVAEIPLGGAVIDDEILNYIMQAMSHFFVVGFIVSFPILALSLLVDIIFGMLMKTMPQFNLLVIGFPIKIAVSFTVLIAVLTSIMLIFKREFFDGIQALQLFF